MWNWQTYAWLKSTWDGEKSLNRSRLWEAFLITLCDFNLKVYIYSQHVQQVWVCPWNVNTQSYFFLFLNLISEWLKSGMFSLSSVLQSSQSLSWFKKHQEKPWQVFKWLMLKLMEILKYFQAQQYALDLLHNNVVMRLKMVGDGRPQLAMRWL